VGQQRIFRPQNTTEIAMTATTKFTFPDAPTLFRLGFGAMRLTDQAEGEAAETVRRRRKRHSSLCSDARRMYCRSPARPRLRTSKRTSACSRAPRGEEAMMTTRKHKTAILTWAVVYPLITTLLAVLEPLLGSLPMPLRTLILTVIMVPVMVYLAMPLASRLAGRWMDDHDLRSGATAQSQPLQETPR